MSKSIAKIQTLVLSLTLTMLLPVGAQAQQDFEPLRRSVERQLAIAEGRGTMSQAQIMKLRAQFNQVLKKRQSTQDAAAISRLTSDLSFLRRQIEQASLPKRAIAVRGFKFF